MSTSSATTRTSRRCRPSHPFRADDRLGQDPGALRGRARGARAARNSPRAGWPRSTTARSSARCRARRRSVVLTKLKRWNAEVPEIHISSDTLNPVIRLQDLRGRLRVGRREGQGRGQRGPPPSSSSRRSCGRPSGSTRSTDDVTGVNRQNRIWRGSRREVEVVFANVRDQTWLADEMFKAGRDTWRFVVDYPFDEQGHSVRDDDQRLDGPAQRGLDTAPSSGFRTSSPTSAHASSVGSPSSTGCSAAPVTGGRPCPATSRPPTGPGTQHPGEPAGRPAGEPASALSRRRTARRSPLPGIWTSMRRHERVLRSLNPGVQPAGAGRARPRLLHSPTSSTRCSPPSFPGHPKFEPGDVEVQGDASSNACSRRSRTHSRTPTGASFVEPAKRDVVRRVANQLGVGHMGETHFLFGPDRFPWSMKFARAMGAAGIDQKDPVTVGTLRGWIRESSQRPGLRPEVADLVDLRMGRSSRAERGTATAPHWCRRRSPVRLTDEMELRPEPLPSHSEWQRAVDCARPCFLGSPASHI